MAAGLEEAVGQLGECVAGAPPLARQSSPAWFMSLEAAMARVSERCTAARVSTPARTPPAKRQWKEANNHLINNAGSPSGKQSTC